MAGLLEDLLSGRSSDIYGAGLLTPEQRGGIGNIGLLALAGKLGQLAGPSFSPVPDFGAALGQAAGAYGASQEGAGTAALNAILTAQKGRKLQQELDYYQKLGPVLGKLAGDWPGAGGGAGGGEGSGSTGGGAAAPLGAGGGGGGAGAGGISPTDHYTFLLNNGASHNEATMLTAAAKAESNFNPDITHDGGIGYGLYGHNSTRLAGMRTTAGVGPKDPVPWQQQALYALAELRGQVPGGGEIKAGDMARAAATPEQLTDAQLAFERPKGWNTGGGNREQRLASTAQYFAKPPYGQPAAAPAGGGGLLAVPAPNPLSDADPIVGTPKPTVAPQAAGGPLAAPAAPGDDARLRSLYDAAVGRVGRESFDQYKARVGPRFGAGSGSSAAAAPGQGASAEEPPGFAGRQLVAQLGARPPLDDASQYRQVAGPGAADAAAPPRAPLPTMGPTGVELPPMQGPLAAPAPAAAAPAAAGPGLLSPPSALPAAPALPRVNPAYDAYLRNAATAAALAKGAGLPDILSPLIEGLKSSPAYRAQQIIAEKTAAQPFEQAQTLYNKQVEIAGVGPIEAAKLPYALAQEYFKADQQIRTAGPVAAAQNFERIKADNAAKGIITTMGADGQIKLSIDPDAVKAVTGATITAPEQAKADIARETTRIQQEQAARYEPIPGGVPVMGADGKTTMVPMSRYEYDLRKRLEGERRGAGAPSSAPQPGDIVGTPYKTPEEQAQTTEEAKGIATQNVAARQTALASREGLILLDQSRDQLQGAGIFTGVGAGTKATVAQFLSQAGFPNDKLASTQVFLQQAGARTAEILRSGTYGTGTAIGATDLRAADKLAIGDNTVELETIKRLFDLAEDKMRRSIDTNNDIAKMRKNPEQIVEHPDRFRGFVGPKEKPEKVYERSDGSRYVLPFVVPGSPYPGKE